MRRERELKLLRKKRLLKRYSDFELSLLASEMNDYTYLLKSIKFPKEELLINKEKNDNKSEEEKEKESSIKNDNNKNKFKRDFSFGDIGNNLQVIKEKEESENEEEYDGLKPKNEINTKKNKRK